MTSRREFLSAVAGSSAVLSFSGLAPSVFCRTAAAGEKEPNGRVLVVVQLSGGNDGLNTIVPHSHDVYRGNRKKLGIARTDTLAIDEDRGLHPEMQGFAKLLEAGQLGIVPAAGYPDPNRSHFESMDIWHTCRRKTQSRESGWLGQYLEQSEADGLAGMHIGSEKQPLALASRRVRVPSVESLERFRLNLSGNDQLGRLLEEKFVASQPAEQNNDLLGFLKTSTQSAVAANKRLEKIRQDQGRSGDFPQTQLGRRLATVARLIKAELPTRVYYVALDGFDTHARQTAAHAALLRQVSDAVTALVTDLNEAGQGDRVLVMCFSEFGRRVAENASEGTDHGTAGPMFVAGKAVRSGFLGPHASLDRLKDGDLQFRTDFRNVYAGILRDWFGSKDTESVLGGSFKPLRLLRTA